MLPAPQWGFGPFRLDPTTACLWRADQLVPLSPKPVAVLAYLVTHAGQVVTKDALLAAVWFETVVSEGVLKTCMRQIRQVLGETAQTPRYIATVHRRGYRFIAPVTVLALSTVAPEGGVEPSPGPVGGFAQGSKAVPVPPARMVAREGELVQLHQLWTQALQGTRQVVFVTGEAGIGKTTLVDAFVAQVMATAAVWFGRGQCIEQYGAGEAYLPLLEALGQLGRGPEGSRLVELLRQQAPSWLLQMPALLPTTEYDALRQRSISTTRERMLRELAEAVETLSRAYPLLLVLEDLHWSDYATMDWLALVARRRVATRLLVLGTYRPADAIARTHPVRSLTQELQRHGQCTELLLPSLPEAGVATYLAQRFDTTQFPAGIAHILHQRTSGNAFFLVTVVEELVRQGLLTRQGEGWTLRGGLDAMAACVPDSIRQLIEHQLAQTTPAAQEILAAASVAGSEFVATAVAAGLGQATADVEACCDALVRQGQFLQAWGSTEWPDGTVAARYRFVHDLYREVLYARVPMSRRVQWHHRIGARLEAGYGPQARELAAELAEHFVRGRDTARAVQYLQYAGEHAVQRSAHQEALRHLTQGLELLGTLPETLTRAQQELDLRMALGPVLMARQGFASAEVEQVYARALELCQGVGETPRLFPVLWGVWAFYAVHGELHTAQHLAERLLALAHSAQDPALLMQAHRALGQTLFYRGEFTPAHTHLEQSLALYDPQQHHSHTFLYGQDSGVFCLALSAEVLALQGFPDQALQRIQEALRLARALAHPLSLAIVLTLALRFYQLRRERHMVQELTTLLTTLATEHGFAQFVASGTIMQGWTLVEQGQHAAGIDQMRQGLAHYKLTGAQAAVLHYLALLAEAYGRGGQPDEGLHVVAEALGFMQQTDNRVYEVELYRLQGELLLVQQRMGQPAEGTRQQRSESAESFLKALGIAHRQQAKSLELRAALSLARLWQQQGKRAAAYGLLAPVYGWFTEGWDTADLQEAKALLADLGG